jgi:S1-C subfamily serine protease
MKTKYLQTFLAAIFVVLFSTGSFCSQRQSENDFGNYIAMQNAIAKYVREKIADPSVFTIYAKPLIVITDKKIKDPKERSEKAIIYRCPLSSIGAGAVIREDGYVITVAHLTDVRTEYSDCLSLYLKKNVEEKQNVNGTHEYSLSAEYQLLRADGEKFYAELIGFDEEKDLSILKATGKNIKMKPVTFTSRSFFSDEAIAVIGAPSGLADMIVLGKVARPKAHNKENHVMIAAPIYPGNSGGVAVDLRDMTVIGLIDEVMLSNGQMMNYGCALHPDAVKNFIKETMKGR